MRISADALRVSALVAAGVASGYLWRAALGPVHDGRLAAPVIVSGEPFVHPAVTLAPSRASKHAAHRHRVDHSRRPVTTLARRVSRVTRAQAISRPVTKPTPKPKPNPGGQAQPQSPAPPATTPIVAPVATPAPVAQQAAVITPSAASSPTVAANDTSNKAKGKTKSNGHDKREADDRGKGSDNGDAATSPPPTDSDRNRPGWGHGDENHGHSGPRGK